MSVPTRTARTDLYTMASEQHLSEGGDQWDRVASELRACRESQQQAYGDIDAATLGRWLAGEASDGEQAQVESAMGDLPQLRQLADLVKDVLGGLDPVSLDPTPLAVAEPVVLPLRRPAPRRAGFFQKRAALAAAACLLAALGLGLPAIVPAQAGSGSQPVALALPAGGDASKGFAGLDKASEPPRGQERMALASPEARPRARASDRRRAFREVSSLTYAGQQAGRRGDFVQATTYYREAQQVCKHHDISELHPATANAIQGEAQLLRLALNDQPAGKGIPTGHLSATHGPYNHAALGGKHDASVLRDRIDRKSIRDIRADVVPVLSAAFRSAATPEDRRAYADALSQVGPAAGPAVRALALRLVRSEDPAEKRAVLKALRAVGPPARQELLAMLDERRDHPKAGHGTEKGAPGMGGRKGFPRLRPLSESEKAQVRDALAVLAGELCNVGVQDTAGRCTVRVAREATDKLRGLVRSRRVEILVETVATDARPDAALRLAGLGERGIYVTLCPDRKTAALHVSESLLREGFPVVQVAGDLDAALAGGGCDRAVAQVPKLLDAALAR